MISNNNICEVISKLIISYEGNIFTIIIFNHISLLLTYIEISEKFDDKIIYNFLNSIYDKNVYKHINYNDIDNDKYKIKEISLYHKQTNKLIYSTQNKNIINTLLDFKHEHFYAKYVCNLI
jgi:hypothetical protein